MKVNFAEHTNKDGVKEIIAYTSYRGKVVRATAKCNPEDSFSEDKGRALASARCEVKVARKRVKRAEEKVKMAYRELMKAQKFFVEMKEYQLFASDELFKLNDKLNKVLEDLR
jgi:hypothetical protein